jgi:hypothetical protein
VNVSKRASSAERRWAALLKVGAVDADHRADDLANVAERPSGATYGSFDPFIRARDVRVLFEHGST